jgi:hypothetical protein
MKGRQMEFNLNVIIYLVVLFVSFVLFIALFLFKKEMKNKAKYKEFLEDAIDGIENNFSSNYDYAHTSTNGISFSKLPNGKIRITSQSKLCGTAINY